MPDTPPSPSFRNGSPPAWRRTGVSAWVLWFVALAGATALLFSVRPRLDKAHVALAFLLVVLGGSAAGGQALGVTLAVVAFLLFNLLFVPPFHTLTVANPFDWIVLAAFLITGVVAAHLLNRAQERAEAARQRAIEVERLAALGAEALNAGRAEEALAAVAEVMRSAMGVERCEMLVPRGTPPVLVPLVRIGRFPEGSETGPPDATASWSLVGRVAEKRHVAAERLDGTTWIGAGDSADGALRWPTDTSGITALLVPLSVRERAVGVLRMSNTTPFALDPNRAQFLTALSYYAALGVERVTLVAEAERAEAFRQADALKSALIAGLSHDLRTPLTTIKAAAHALGERGSSEAILIEEEADRLNHLMADLLDLSRLNARALPMRPELNAVDDLVGAAVRRVSGSVGQRRLHIVAEDRAALGSADDQPILVGWFDFVQTLRALVNLIENAAKYGPPNEPIEIGVDRDGSWLRIMVADRGPGVDPAERERIFEPFYRAPGVPPDVGGAGLGLAIARRLAAEQGGDVTYSPRPGGGSLFVLRLPVPDVELPSRTEVS